MSRDSFTDILDAADSLTQAELKNRISSLTRLSEADIQSICPEKQDKVALAKLLQIVNGAVSDNAKKKQLAENLEQFGVILLRILAKVVV
jgi:hypothetical protein